MSFSQSNLDMCNSAEALQRKLKGTKDVALERVVAALRDPLTLDNARAEWVAQQLLESGEKGILLPVTVVLDAYIRGKSRQACTPTSALCTRVRICNDCISICTTFASPLALPGHFLCTLCTRNG